MWLGRPSGLESALHSWGSARRRGARAAHPPNPPRGAVDERDLALALEGEDVRGDAVAGEAVRHSLGPETSEERSVF